MLALRSLLFKFILIYLAWTIGAYTAALVLPIRTMVRITQEDIFFENITFLARLGPSG